MDDSSNSQQPTNPNSTYPPGFGFGSTRSSSPSVGNHPPPPSPPPPTPSLNRGAATSSSKRRSNPNLDKKEELEDDADSQFTRIKRHQTGSPRRKEEIDLLKDIFEFYKKTERYPYDHFKDLKEFNSDWSGKRSRVYENEDELKTKMEELHERFLSNLVKTRNGEVLEDLMDDIEVEIYLLSYKVWVLEEEEDDDDNGGKDSSKDEKISKDSSQQQETGEDDDGDGGDDDDDDDSKDLSTKDSKDLSFKDSSNDSTKGKLEGLSSKDSKDSLSKDSKDSKDSSSKDSKDFKDSSAKDSKE